MRSYPLVMLIFGFLVMVGVNSNPRSEFFLIITGIFTFFSLLISILTVSLLPSHGIHKLYGKTKPKKSRWVLFKVIISTMFVGSFTFICYNYGYVVIGSILYSLWLVLRIHEYRFIDRNLWSKTKQA